MKKKSVERAYLELARTWYEPFPHGSLVDSESPDFLLPTADRIVGFEVTRLFQPPRESRFSPRQIETFRESVVTLAHDIYTGSDGPPVDVNAYGPVHPQPRQDKRVLAESLSAFVRANYPADDKVLLFREGDRRRPPPNGFGVVSVARPLPGHVRPWFVGGVGETVLLTYDFLADAISAKNSLAMNYRSRVDEMWLLIVIDLFPMSMGFAVPNEIDGWCIEHSFDEVLLLSRECARVWSIKSARSVVESWRS